MALMQELTRKYKGIIWRKHTQLVNVFIPMVTNAGTHRTWSIGPWYLGQAYMVLCRQCPCSKEKGPVSIPMPVTYGSRSSTDSIGLAGL